MKCTVELIEKISPELEEKMSRDLIAYEKEHGIDINYKTFSFILKNETGVVIGILNAFTAFAEIYIDDIWIDSGYRGRGFGKKLMQKLEDQFKGKGFNNINLVTNAFQAPGFYEKCGYSIEFIRENRKNPKLNKIFFVKFFQEESQTQGILSYTRSG